MSISISVMPRCTSLFFDVPDIAELSEWLRAQLSHGDGRPEEGFGGA
jgi:hypothetical protein